MNTRLNNHFYGRFWAIGLTAVLFIIGQFAAKGQTSPLKIAAPGAESTFEQPLFQPTQFLQSMGIALENVELQSARTRINVVGAGFVRDRGIISSTFTFTNTQISLKPKSDIQVIGASFADTISLVSPQFGDLTQQTSTLEPTQTVTPLPMITEPPAAQNTPVETTPVPTVFPVTISPTATPPAATSSTATSPIATTPEGSSDSSGMPGAIIWAAVIGGIATILGAIIANRRN